MMKLFQYVSGVLIVNALPILYGLLARGISAQRCDWGLSSQVRIISPSVLLYRLTVLRSFEDSRLKPSTSSKRNSGNLTPGRPSFVSKVIIHAYLSLKMDLRIVIILRRRLGDHANLRTQFVRDTGGYYVAFRDRVFLEDDLLAFEDSKPV